MENLKKDTPNNSDDHDLTKEVTLKSSETSSILKRLSVIFTAATVFGGISLHFLGQVSHSAYLREWGLDSSSFPKPIDWYSLNGYYTLFDRTVILATSIMSDIKIVSMIGAGIFVVILYLQFLNYVTKSEKVEGQKNWLQKLPVWMRQLLLNLALTVLSTSLIPLILALAGIALAIPGVIGESRGREIAEKERENFNKGCENISPPTKCLSLKKNGKVVTTGFLIDSSETYIAIYEVNSRKVRVLERNGLETEIDQAIGKTASEKTNSRTK